MTIFNNFAKFVLSHSDKTILESYNAFIKSLSENEKIFVSNNYMLFIKTGESARNASQSVKTILQEV